MLVVWLSHDLLLQICRVCLSNCQGQPNCISYCIWMTSSSIHICTLKQHSMFTCRQNKHTQRHIVEGENAISNCENFKCPDKMVLQISGVPFFFAHSCTRIILVSFALCWSDKTMGYDFCNYLQDKDIY